MFSDLKINWIHLEITEMCNLKCPLCARSAYKKSGEDKYTASLSLEQVKKFINPSFIQQSDLKYVLFCGTYGDPIMAPDVFAITQYFHEQRVDVSIATNGALRNKEWWAMLGREFKTGVEVIFAIDGLEDTNQIYRVGADWSRLMENCKAFIGSGGRAVWQFIPFKHNEHQIEAAKALAQEMGFSSFVVRKSNRLMWYKDKTQSGLEDPIRRDLQIQDRDKKLQDVNTWIDAGQKVIMPSCKSLSSKNHPLILRKDLNGKNIKITARGIVYPCSWFQPQSWYEDNGLVTSDFDLNKNSLEDILSNYFFNQGLMNKWKAGEIRVCVGYCSIGAVVEQNQTFFKSKDEAREVY